MTWDTIKENIIRLRIGQIITIKGPDIYLYHLSSHGTTTINKTIKYLPPDGFVFKSFKPNIEIQVNEQTNTTLEQKVKKLLNDYQTYEKENPFTTNKQKEEHEKILTIIEKALTYTKEYSIIASVSHSAQEANKGNWINIELEIELMYIGSSKEDLIYSLENSSEYQAPF
ncbi:hypothetical protein [Bacillus toyonensis]|uniref:hypothetical protein n=1 Tax=Bacillus toyonensis TaxID=155322 RepID=UPI000BFC84E9|nr:hypothetical protein [Bacillus toyonensis]PHB48335.1 hypothetical protein COE91_22790 [Bacillus toyonensis]